MRLRAATFIPIRKNTPSCFASLFRDAGRKAAARESAKEHGFQVVGAEEKIA